jgi:uridine kinase
VTRVARYADLAARILAAPPRLGSVRFVAVDGPSGAGKSAFAERLAAALAGAATLVRGDELLDGWSDQVTFWPRLEAWVLAPLRAGRDGAVRPYDWVAGRRRDAWVRVPHAPVLIVEGVTSARAAARPELTLSVFVVAPEPVRRARVMARDGAGVEPYLAEWARGEAAFYAADRTAEHADLVVDGDPHVAHDPVDEFVVSGAAASP